jgi:hypothetical protein
MTFNKIFGVGLSKTGTLSLTAALERLGYTAIHCPDVLELFKILKEHDAATDTPIATFYKQLDKMFPNSKFILTTRELKSWLKSCSWFFSKKRTPDPTDQQKFIRTYLYDSVHYDEKKYSKSYKKHIEDVKSYFKNRSKDLLIMNILEGDGYEKLCPFLGLKVIKEKFPHKNTMRLMKLKHALSKIKFPN